MSVNTAATRLDPSFVRCSDKVHELGRGVTPMLECMEMEGTPVKVRFRCQMTGCRCETKLDAHVFVREEGKFYEYKSGPNCPECGHKLFSKHRPAGELPAQKASD